MDYLDRIPSRFGLALPLWCPRRLGRLPSYRDCLLEPLGVSDCFHTLDASAVACLPCAVSTAEADTFRSTLDYMLDQYPGNRGARFLICVAAIALALAYLGVNLATK